MTKGVGRRDNGLLAGRGAQGLGSDADIRIVLCPQIEARLKYGGGQLVPNQPSQINLPGQRQQAPRAWHWRFVFAGAGAVAHGGELA